MSGIPAGNGKARASPTPRPENLRTPHFVPLLNCIDYSSIQPLTHSPWHPFAPIAARLCASAGTTRRCLPRSRGQNPDADGPSDHITELNNTTPKQPFFFLKPASSILLPGAGPILRPKGVSLHYEVELGLVMGKTLRDLDTQDEKSALDAIQSEFAPTFSHYILECMH